MGPIPMIASFLLARASLGLLADRDEPVGARRWLIYPSLLVWYVPLALVLAIFPIAAAAPLTEQPSFRDWFTATLPGPVWLAASSLAAMAQGLWWVIVGVVFLRFTPAVQIAFSPFADRFGRRHARWIVYAGLLLTIAAGLVFWAGTSRI